MQSAGAAFEASPRRFVEELIRYGSPRRLRRKPCGPIHLQTCQSCREAAERLTGDKHLPRLGVCPSRLFDEERVLQCDVLDDGVNGIREGLHARSIDVDAGGATVSGQVGDDDTVLQPRGRSASPRPGDGRKGAHTPASKNLAAWTANLPP